VNAVSLTKIHKIAVQAAWALLFVSLPVTSFPYFPGGLGGKILVRPLAIYPLIILLVLVTIPSLFKRPIPQTILPLFAFIVVTIISSVIAFTSEREALRGVTMSSRFVRNIITLGIGCAFYLTIALGLKSWDDLKYSLRWLYIGFGIALLWGSLQAIYVIHFSRPYFKLISQFQSYISSRKLFQTRISGLTYEPKWFAEQICLLLLPWLLGSILTNRSIFKWRYKRLTVEWLFLVWSIGILTFTYSRSGMIIMAMLVFVSFMLYRYYFQARNREKNELTTKKRSRRSFAEILLVVVSIVTILVIVGAQNPYFSRFWRYWTEAEKRNRTYLEYIAIQSRVVYWETAIRIYDAYPVLGVGLGNYAFYFTEMLPEQSWFRQPEIVRQITPEEGRNRLITPKSLAARLLAETGLVGSAIFITFILAIIGCVLFLWLSPSLEQRFWGLGGMLAMLVFAFVIFSFDSFALPNMWVVFGLVTAAAHNPDPALPPG